MCGVHCSLFSLKNEINTTTSLKLIDFFLSTKYIQIPINCSANVKILKHLEKSASFVHNKILHIKMNAIATCPFHI